MSIPEPLVMHLDVTERKRDEDASRRLAAAMDAVEDGVFLIDRASMRFIYANESACRQHGMRRERMLALNPWEIFGTSRQALARTYDALIAGGGTGKPEGVRRTRDGIESWIEIRQVAQCAAGRWTVVVMLRDITVRKEADDRIAYLNRVRAVMSGINTLIMRVRHREELFSKACRIAVEQGGFPSAWIGLVDPTRTRIVPVASAGLEEDFLAAISERLVLGGDAPFGGLLSVRAIREKIPFVSSDTQKDARIMFGKMHAKYGIRSIAVLPLVVVGEAVGVFVLLAREPGFFKAEELRLLEELAGDVAFAMDHIEKQERLDYLAYYDALTGLANRTLFIERVSQHLKSAAAPGRRAALYLIDLERFKNINDSLGRPAGDALLKQFAEWLTSSTGDAALLARVGADVFAMVVPEVAHEEDLARRLETLLNALSEHAFVLDNAVYRISAKAGVALFPSDGVDTDGLFKNAEVALKKAKSGGDRYLFYAQRMTATVAGRLSLENQLRQAVEREEFVLHYQPKLNLTTREIAGAEALIRWNHPTTGLMLPSKFIPVLEETRLIYEVGRWALHKAIADYLHWCRSGLKAVRIAVNVSPLQLRNRNFVGEIQRTVGVDAGASAGLELEITEGVIMEDVKHSISGLQAIRDMGVRIAIDDFGTGFSSLNYLAKLPVDTLKIDRSFVGEMNSGPEGLSLISIIINLAHSLRLQVVAEGVEKEEQARLLRLLFCDEMQGRLASKPLPAAIFAKRYLMADTKAG